MMMKCIITCGLGLVMINSFHRNVLCVYLNVLDLNFSFEKPIHTNM